MRIDPAAIPTSRPSAAPRPDASVDARLLIARAEAEQSRIVGEVLDASLGRMAENRERREAERLEDARETDRLRAAERREQADAARVARNAERRAAAFRADARQGDRDADLRADRERGRADDARRRERGAQLDIRA